MSELYYEGKSKSVYSTGDEDTCLIKFRNTATAFDGKKREELDDKGRLNAAISNIIYEYLEENGVETHLVEVLDESSILARRVEVVPIEVIIRNVAAGSFSKKYGVEEGTELLNTVLEFSLKSDELHDPMINDSHITAMGLSTEEELQTLKTQALLINDLLIALFLKADITLVDFKLEFGRFKGELILCDEISPDSCRLWDVQTQSKLDKDRFRRDLGSVMESYSEVLRRLKLVRNL